MPSMNLTTRRGKPTGFSLVELLVVVAIIAIIAGLLFAGVSTLRNGAKESQARAVLASLMGYRGQFETQFKTTAAMPSHLDNDPTYDWSTAKRLNAPGASGPDIKIDTGKDLAGAEYTYSNGDTNKVYMERANIYMKRFIWVVNQMPVIREGLPSLANAFGDFDKDGFLEVVDPWGNPIAYAQSVEHGIAGNSDDDFLPEHDNPFFASAGKDKLWGRPKTSGEFANPNDWDDYKKTDEYKFSVDNLYSFDIDRSAAQRGD